MILVDGTIRAGTNLLLSIIGKVHRTVANNTKSSLTKYYARTIPHLMYCIAPTGNVTDRVQLWFDNLETIEYIRMKESLVIKRTCSARQIGCISFVNVIGAANLTMPISSVERCSL
jgi:hypothetical protein